MPLSRFVYSFLFLISLNIVLSIFLPFVPVTWAQTEQILQPETLAERKADLQAQLDALGPVDETAGGNELRGTLEQFIATLSAIEQALQNRERYTTQLAELPERRRQLEAERKKLEQAPPTKFTEINPALREQYQARLQAALSELEKLPQEIATRELRINAITEQLNQQNERRRRLERELAEAQRRLEAATDKTVPRLQLEHLEWQLKALPLQTTALEAERGWLTARLPLFDEQRRVTRLQLDKLQRDLEIINAALGETIAEERATLATRSAEIAEQQTQTTNPIEQLKLTLASETVAIRDTTLDYREQLIALGTESKVQKQLSARLTRDVERLKLLVNNTTGDEVVGQRILVVFERLRELHQRYSDQPRRALQARINQLNQRLFKLEDRLFDFDQQAEAYLAEAESLLSARALAQGDKTLAELRTQLDTQKKALRDQQQVLRALVQEVAELISLHQQYQRTLDGGYGFALAHVFWIRNAPPLTGQVVQNMLGGVVTTVGRLADFILAEIKLVHAALGSGSSESLLVLAVVLLLPVLLYMLQRWLRELIKSWLAAQRQRNELPQVGPGLLIVLQSALWPAYVWLLAWLWDRLPQASLEQAQLTSALVDGLQLAALIIWIALVGRGLLLQDGWGQRFWQLSPRVCRFIQRSIVLGCLAGLVFMVPREVLLAAPGEPEVAASSLALARLLFLAFELAVLVLVGIVGWRNSPLMQLILANSRKEDGLLWRLWPALYAVFLLGLVAVMLMGMLGYRYAALFIFFRSFGSLLILLITRLFLPLLIFRLLQQIINYLFDRAARSLQRDASVQDTAVRTLRIASVGANILLFIVTAFVILELWGVPAAWVVASPLTWLIVSRVLGIAIVIGLTLLLLRLSRAVTRTLLQPRTRQGRTREAGRKLRTLAPLVQTTINVLILLIATLSALQLLGLSLGPVLAGVGILGLAVGFAAQSLIKDIINGLFILFEDALSVGDIVDVGGGVSGQVEKVSLRSLTVRDFSGNVHVVPNGTIDRVANMTKDFSRYVLNVGIAYREDVDYVIGILQEIDAGMRADPDYGKDMLEPIEILGVDRFEDSAVVIVARLTTRPIQQWRIGREFNRRMKQVFDERGIEIPFPHRTLYWGEPKAGSQPPVQVAFADPAQTTASLRPVVNTPKAVTAARMGEDSA